MSHRLMKTLPAGMQRWSTKHGSENCGVGKTLCHWQLQADADCPRCGNPEDTTHVLRCADTEATSLWSAHMIELGSLLADLHTPLELHTAVLDRLQHWRQNIPFVVDPTWSPQLRATIQSQDTIGWKCFLEGLPTKLLSRYMDVYYSSQGFSFTGNSWLYKIQRRSHLMAWSLWEHRNTTLHDERRPRHKQALHFLHQSITHEYLQGRGTLPPSQHHFFRLCLIQLLSRHTHFKQSWLQNLHAARDREDRRRMLLTEDRSASALYLWMKTGRLRSLPNPP
ncbi:expressed unknown protein [Seminavis robusta]|uniref:Uncharacterized protein n=1 Tax=Seminavis robusta TaxID=568900 RepID=A0A9N8EDA5_9STRA|nr:expressed unknown protein [Seminavis robusta]|eukprot:Sro828_g207951.1  (280) ;mRNA; f:13752-14591